MPRLGHALAVVVAVRVEACVGSADGEVVGLHEELGHEFVTALHLGLELLDAPEPGVEVGGVMRWVATGIFLHSEK